jgi:hypothetical protein
VILHAGAVATPIKLSVARSYSSVGALNLFFFFLLLVPKIKKSYHRIDGWQFPGHIEFQGEYSPLAVKGRKIYIGKQ